MREKKKCIIFGASGKISKLIIKYFIKKNYFITGISKKSRIYDDKDYQHIYFDITKPVSKKIIKIINQKNLKFIFFCINKNEQKIDFEEDFILMAKYHLFFPIKVAKLLKKANNPKIILMNSDIILKKNDNFIYSSIKLLSSYFISFAKYYLRKKIKFYSILMGKINSTNINKLNKVLYKLNNNQIQNKSININLDNKKNIAIKFD